MSTIIEVEYFNTYILKNLQSERLPGSSAYPGVSFPGSCRRNTTLPDRAGGNGQKWDILLDPSRNVGGPWNWFVEESRIRGGYNNVSTDLGVRAYLDEPFPIQQKRINTLIYSGVYNSRTGINQTNVFSVSESITRSLDPLHGSIQKTYSEDTNLIVFQENKIHRALIDKDTIYTTESGTQTQAGAAVIGQFVPYKGEYGISKNPESFAIYNYRKYFTDKNRNAVMRLSNDGLTEISMYGMMDYFRDNLALISDEPTAQTISLTKTSGGITNGAMLEVSIPSFDDIPTVGMAIQGQPAGTYVTNVKTSIISGNLSAEILYSLPFTSTVPTTVIFKYNTKGKLIGGWDIHNKNYLLSLQKTPNQVSSSESSYDTISFDEKINGWVSFFTFKPTNMFSVLNKFYSLDQYNLYLHYDDTTVDNRGLFYGVRSPSNVTFVINPRPNIQKNFQTISYEGSNGWEITSYVSGFTGFDPNPSNPSAYIQDQDKNYVDPVTLIGIRSYDEGLYTDTVTGQPLRAGFDRKENRYVANLVSNSAVRAGEVIFGNQMSGIKGYFATIKIQSDATTQLGGPKELWSASSKYVVSST